MRDVVDRALARVEDWSHPAGCWIWCGVAKDTAYGQIAVDGRRESKRQTGVHRAVYEGLVEPLAPGVVIDHLCRERLCVNPLHMEPVTRGENTRRGVGPWGNNQLGGSMPRQTMDDLRAEIDERDTQIEKLKLDVDQLRQIVQEQASGYRLIRTIIEDNAKR